MGQTWNGTTCTGEPKSFTLSEAQAQLKTHRLGGYSDWQLPTILQFNTLVQCKNGFEYTTKIPSAPFSGDITVLDGCVGDREPNQWQLAVDNQIFPNMPNPGARLRDGSYNLYLTSSSNSHVPRTNESPYYCHSSYNKIKEYGMNFSHGKIDPCPSGGAGNVRAVRTTESLGINEYKALLDKRRTDKGDNVAQTLQKEQLEQKRQAEAEEAKAKAAAAERARKERENPLVCKQRYIGELVHLSRKSCGFFSCDRVNVQYQVEGVGKNTMTVKAIDSSYYGERRTVQCNADSVD